MLLDFNAKAGTLILLCSDRQTGGRGEDGAQKAWTSRWVDGRSGGRANWAVGASRAWTASQADGQTGRQADQAVRGGRNAVRGGRNAVRRTRRMGRLTDEGVGSGLKGHIPRGPFHSWAPSPLALSEHKCVGCLGVRWGPRGFPVKHPYLAPGLTCLV